MVVESSTNMFWSKYKNGKWVEKEMDCQHQNVELKRIGQGILQCPLCDCYICEVDYFNINKIESEKEIITAGQEYIQIGIGLMPTTEKQYIVKTEYQRRLYENIKYQLEHWNNLFN